MMDLQQLSAPFDPSKVSWRVGATTKNKSKGMALAYIDARDVMERLDDVCGIGNWQCKYSHAGQKTICDIGIRINNEWVWKANGAGDSDVEAEKGAASDAFKRAAVVWGVGRYLYDIKSPWVELNQYKQFANPNDPAFARALGQNPASQRTTSNPQTQEEVGEVLDWAQVAADLILKIKQTDHGPDLGTLKETGQYVDFKNRAPQDLVNQVVLALKERANDLVEASKARAA
jgi:hypothetical protein